MALVPAVATNTVLGTGPVAVSSTSILAIGGALLNQTLGDLSINSSTLNIGSIDNTGSPYSVAFAGSTGVTTLTGNPSIVINNSISGGAATLTLGSLNDGGTPRTITFNGLGTINLNSPATSLVSGTRIVVPDQFVSSGPTANLVSEFQFGEGYGKTTFDTGSNHLTGTLVGNGVAYTTAAKTGVYALNFTSANSYVQIPQSSLRSLAATPCRPG